MSKIHLLIFPGWTCPGDDELKWPHHAVFFTHMRAARRIGPEALGLRMGSGDDDLKAAMTVVEGFDRLEDDTLKHQLRPLGGYMRFDNHAYKRMKMYWIREDRQEGTVGYRAFLGDARVKIIYRMQEFWDDKVLNREVTPEEFAAWQEDHPEWVDLYPIEPIEKKEDDKKEDGKPDAKSDQDAEGD